MKAKKTLIVASLSVIAALAVGVGSGSALITRPRKVTCKVQSTSQSPGKLTGYDLGFVNCPPPGGGKGLHYDTFKNTVIPPNKVSGQGTFKEYFDSGTVHGTYRLGGTFVGTSGTASGPLKVLGGTGAFRHMTGSGKLTCTTPDGVHNNCTIVVRETGI